MKLLYDENLVEAVVFLIASGRRRGAPSLQLRRFHREREKLYALLDPEERDAAFFQLHLAWFREWGAEQSLTGIVKEFPLLPGSLKVLAFRQARNQSEEGAELYVNAASRRHGIVALRPERFADDPGLERFLRHELMHLSDMIDPAFAYSPEIRRPRQTAAQQRLARERYRLLWDATIDGRLVNSTRLTVATEEHRRTEFERAYAFLPDHERQQIFQSLWNNPSPRHEILRDLAADPRNAENSARPIPGGACPLCGFPTFDWADSARFNPETVAIIRRDFTDWNPGQGACGRCLDVYESARSAPLPGAPMDQGANVG